MYIFTSKIRVNGRWQPVYPPRSQPNKRRADFDISGVLIHAEGPSHLENITYDLINYITSCVANSYQLFCLPGSLTFPTISIGGHQPYYGLTNIIFTMELPHLQNSFLLKMSLFQKLWTEVKCLIGT